MSKLLTDNSWQYQVGLSWSFPDFPTYSIDNKWQMVKNFGFCLLLEHILEAKIYIISYSSVSLFHRLPDSSKPSKGKLLSPCVLYSWHKMSIFINGGDRFCWRGQTSCKHTLTNSVSEEPYFLVATDDFLYRNWIHTIEYGKGTVDQVWFKSTDARLKCIPQ